MSSRQSSQDGERNRSLIYVKYKGEKVIKKSCNDHAEDISKRKTIKLLETENLPVTQQVMQNSLGMGAAGFWFQNGCNPNEDHILIVNTRGEPGLNFAKIAGNTIVSQSVDQKSTMRERVHSSHATQKNNSIPDTPNRFQNDSKSLNMFGNLSSLVMTEPDAEEDAHQQAMLNQRQVSSLLQQSEVQMKEELSVAHIRPIKNNFKITHLIQQVLQTQHEKEKAAQRHFKSKIQKAKNLGQSRAASGTKTSKSNSYIGFDSGNSLVYPTKRDAMMIGSRNRISSQNGRIQSAFCIQEEEKAYPTALHESQRITKNFIFTGSNVPRQIGEEAPSFKTINILLNRPTTGRSQFQLKKVNRNVQRQQNASTSTEKSKKSCHNFVQVSGQKIQSNGIQFQNPTAAIGLDQSRIPFQLQQPKTVDSVKKKRHQLGSSSRERSASSSYNKRTMEVTYQTFLKKHIPHQEVTSQYDLPKRIEQKMELAASNKLSQKKVSLIARPSIFDEQNERIQKGHSTLARITATPGQNLSQISERFFKVKEATIQSASSLSNTQLLEKSQLLMPRMIPTGSENVTAKDVASSARDQNQDSNKKQTSQDQTIQSDYDSRSKPRQTGQLLTFAGIALMSTSGGHQKNNWNAEKNLKIILPISEKEAEKANKMAQELKLGNMNADTLARQAKWLTQASQTIARLKKQLSKSNNLEVAPLTRQKYISYMIKMLEEDQFS